MIDPRETYKSAEVHVRSVRRTGMRLVFSGIGFSAAYFFDPEHGATRRKQAIDLIRRGRLALAKSRNRATEPTDVMVVSATPVSRTSGLQLADDGLRMAR